MGLQRHISALGSYFRTIGPYFWGRATFFPYVENPTDEAGTFDNARRNLFHGGQAMTKTLQDYGKIAAACAKAATEATKSQGDREHLLQMQKRYLELAEKQEIGRPKAR
jgi:hypothetical protein